MCTLSGCIAVVAGGAAAGGYVVGKDDRTVEQIARDAAITTSVKTSLLRDSQIHGFDINVDTKVGIVTLRGHVEDRKQYERAKELSESVKDVKEVKMELRIIP
jgi:hyperosmotically inducible protein|tara:strand:+ start:279 stop:587 length:309 start_codon:yes stop_codon:yes gene_type:complete